MCSVSSISHAIISCQSRCVTIASVMPYMLRWVLHCSGRPLRRYLSYTSCVPSGFHFSFSFVSVNCSMLMCYMLLGFFFSLLWSCSCFSLRTKRALPLLLYVHQLLFTSSSTPSPRPFPPFLFLSCFMSSLLSIACPQIIDLQPSLLFCLFVFCLDWLTCFHMHFLHAVFFFSVLFSTVHTIY